MTDNSRSLLNGAEAIRCHSRFDFCELDGLSNGDTSELPDCRRERERSLSHWHVLELSDPTIVKLRHHIENSQN
jgi:hypothetical protein